LPNSSNARNPFGSKITIMTGALMNASTKVSWLAECDGSGDSCRSRCRLISALTAALRKSDGQTMVGETSLSKQP
jgi:hypothetical protein